MQNTGEHGNEPNTTHRNEQHTHHTEVHRTHRYIEHVELNRIHAGTKPDATQDTRRNEPNTGTYGNKPHTAHRNNSVREEIEHAHIVPR